MNLVTFINRNRTGVGILLDDRVLDLSKLGDTQKIARKVKTKSVFNDMVSLIEAGPQIIQFLEEAVEGSSKRKRPKGDKLFLPLNQVKIAAPIPRPRKNVFCVGMNYLEHVREGAAVIPGRSGDAPEFPNFFTKPPTAVIGDGDAIVLDPSVTQSLDYEVELGVVIGRRGVNIPESDALSYVFGYTIINDISARNLQRRQAQWFKGKSLDTTCPMGPCIVLRQDIPSPQNLNIRLSLNGQEMQSSNTRYMIFSIPKLICELSLGMMLEPGDIIATGTPSGVGSHRQPPIFLKVGDMLHAEIEGIGVLRNHVALAPSITQNPSTSAHP